MPRRIRGGPPSETRFCCADARFVQWPIASDRLCFPQVDASDREIARIASCLKVTSSSRWSQLRDVFSLNHRVAASSAPVGVGSEAQ